jgi:hypothetical protein
MSGRVLDEKGRPFVGAEVWANVHPPTGKGAEFSCFEYCENSLVTAATTTDVNGRFTLDSDGDCVGVYWPNGHGIGTRCGLRPGIPIELRLRRPFSSGTVRRTLAFLRVDLWDSPRASTRVESLPPGTHVRILGVRDPFLHVEVQGSALQGWILWRLLEKDRTR